VRFIGVTGHGTRVAAMHRASLDRFDFDSVLLPLNFVQMRDPRYAAEFEALAELCAQKRVAVQTIKCIARRRWSEGAAPRTTTWYEPLEEQADIDRALHWALDRPGIFVNSASDVRLLERLLHAAQRCTEAPPQAAMEGMAEHREMAPLFVRGFAGSAA